MSKILAQKGSSPIYAPCSSIEQGAVKESKRAGDMLGRLARWFEREDTLLKPEEVSALYRSNLHETQANQLAIDWGERYARATETERYELLTVLSLALPYDTQRDQASINVFRRLYAQNKSLELMLQLRADMLRWHVQIEGVAFLEYALAALLLNWFDVGMLRLRPITWESPAALLEKLIEYEAVHEIQSWGDMKRRVADDRRCYAFFHPQLPDEPLIFVEVALAAQMTGQVQELLDPDLPVADLKNKGRWAIFYSITNAQQGLRGISFGGFLLKRVMEELHKELPAIRHFATLSPIPGFTRWLEKQENPEFKIDLSDRTFFQSEQVKRQGLRMMARYLSSLDKAQAIDAVAKFHLGNGASIGRINWAADLSEKGMTQSAGMMVNYVYESNKLDKNIQSLAAGQPSMSREVRRLLSS